MAGQRFSSARNAFTTFAMEMGRAVTEFSRSKRRRSVAVCATSLTVSCVLLLGTEGCAPRETQRVPRTPLTAGGGAGGVNAPVAVSRTIITPTDAASIEEIFSRARVDLAEKRFADAARGFDRVGELDADGQHAKDAWILSASAHDQSGDLSGAAARYLE